MRMISKKGCDVKVLNFIKTYGFDENEFRISRLLIELAENAKDNKLISDKELEETLLMAYDLNDAVISYCPLDTISQILRKYKFDDNMIFQISEKMDKIASILLKNKIISPTQKDDIRKIAYHMSVAFNPCRRTKIYYLKRDKKIKEMEIDEDLDEQLLDSMNANKTIEISHVEAGHDCPPEPNLSIYKGNFPEISFDYKGNLPIKAVENIINNLPDIDLRGNPFTKLDGSTGYHLVIRGTHKGDQKWWNNVAKILSTLK